MKIKGTKKVDTLNGTEADDIIRGGRGADTVNGGDGFDILIGGKGRDTFIVAPGDLDVIADFDAQKDRVIIDADLYGPGMGGGPKPAPLDGPVDYASPYLSYEGEPVALLSGVRDGGAPWLSFEVLIG